MESYENVKDFYDYLIIDDDGWKDVREDAPEKAKKAFKIWQQQQKENLENGIR